MSNKRRKSLRNDLHSKARQDLAEKVLSKLNELNLTPTQFGRDNYRELEFNRPSGGISYMSTVVNGTPAGLNGPVGRNSKDFPFTERETYRAGLLLRKLGYSDEIVEQQISNYYITP